MPHIKLQRHWQNTILTSSRRSRDLGLSLNLIKKSNRLTRLKTRYTPCLLWSVPSDHRIYLEIYLFDVAGIILCMRQANERRRYKVTPCLIGWAHTQYDHWCFNIWIYADSSVYHDVVKWEPFPRNWPFVRGIHLSPVDPPQKGQWR